MTTRNSRRGSSTCSFSFSSSSTQHTVSPSPPLCFSNICSSLTGTGCLGPSNLFSMQNIESTSGLRSHDRVMIRQTCSSSKTRDNEESQGECENYDFGVVETRKRRIINIDILVIGQYPRKYLHKSEEHRATEKRGRRLQALIRFYCCNDCCSHCWVGGTIIIGRCSGPVDNSVHNTIRRGELQVNVCKLNDNRKFFHSDSNRFREGWSSMRVVFLICLPYSVPPFKSSSLFRLTKPSTASSLIVRPFRNDEFLVLLQITRGFIFFLCTEGRNC